MNLSGTEGNVLQYWYAEQCVGAPGLECFPLSVGKGDWLSGCYLYTVPNTGAAALLDIPGNTMALPP